MSHGVTAGWDAEDIVHEALDELLSEILAGEVALREFSRSQKLVEGYGLRSKWGGWLLTRGHADDTPAVMEERPYAAPTLLDHLGRVKCIEGAARV